MARAARLALAAAALLAPAAPVAGAPPRRIVSINPCLDAILMAVADPTQIAGISAYSQDPRATSIPLAQARRFPATSGTAEEVMALAPDLVVAGGHVAPSTANALARLGVRLLQLDVPVTIAQSRAQIRTIAAVTGHPDRGAAAVARIDAALAAARAPDARRIPALIWQGGGLVPGSGTLAGELLERTGFHNLSADYGLKTWDILPIEYLVARPPALLLSTTASDAPQDRMLAHPAIVKLGRRITVRPYPFRLLQCGGPTIATAVTRLAALRRGLPAGLAAR